MSLLLSFAGSVPSTTIGRKRKTSAQYDGNETRRNRGNTIHIDRYGFTFSRYCDIFKHGFIDFGSLAPKLDTTIVTFADQSDNYNGDGDGGGDGFFDGDGCLLYTSDAADE